MAKACSVRREKDQYHVRTLIETIAKGQKNLLLGVKESKDKVPWYNCRVKP